jgi:hypothetical protein
VGRRTSLEDVERRKISPLPGIKLLPLGRPTRSQSLYRLPYPGSSYYYYYYYYYYSNNYRTVNNEELRDL